MSIKMKNPTEEIIVTKFQLAELFNNSAVQFQKQYKKEKGKIVYVDSGPFFKKFETLYIQLKKTTHENRNKRSS